MKVLFHFTAFKNTFFSCFQETKLEELKKQLSGEQRERKSEVNNVKMKYDSRVAIMNEEIVSLKSQCSKYRRERESYKVNDVTHI